MFLVYAKVIDEQVDEFYLGELFEGESSESGSEDEGEQDSDASGPTLGYPKGGPGGCMLSSAGGDLFTDSASTVTDHFSANECKGYIADDEGTDTGKDVSELGNQGRSEYLQEESFDEMQLEDFNTNKRICDATFIMNSFKANPSSTSRKLFQVYKKPVSIAQPLSSAGAKLPSDTSFSEEDELDSDNSNGDCNLAQAALLSRDRIALALSMVSEEEPENFSQGTSSKNALSQGTSLRGGSMERASSQGPLSRAIPLKGTSSRSMSLKSTFSKKFSITPIFQAGRKSKVIFQNSKHSEPTFDNAVASCSTMLGGEESCYQASEVNFDEKTNDDAAMSCKLNGVLEHKRSMILASSECYQLCSSVEKSRSIPRRRSLKIIPPCTDQKLKSSVKLEGVYFKDSFHGSSSPNSRSKSSQILRVSDKDTVAVSPCSLLEESRTSQEHQKRSHLVVTSSERGGYTLGDNAKMTGKPSCVELCDQGKLIEVVGLIPSPSNKQHMCGDRTVSPHCKEDVKCRYRTAGSLNDLVSSPRKTSKRLPVSASGLCSNNSTSGSQVGKRIAKKSIQMNEQDSVPSKQAKRGSSMSTKERKRDSLQLKRSSGPVRLQETWKAIIMDWDGYRTELLSPIRRNVPASCQSTPEAVLSPCKGKGACDKAFCFHCW
ncbi:hypothetical protein AWC38_SpisGene15525 [Stylophora pistillata]|uniref:Uncharacterized protein n=1 Tax=Stylophora pistillata TaxID=50429 RepID=A0A2B4RU24_STYPI|nr:hypothetical protein AWC38_SpisGene15525 [Stylophora pistillata]